MVVRDRKAAFGAVIQTGHSNLRNDLQIPLTWPLVEIYQTPSGESRLPASGAE